MNGSMDPLMMPGASPWRERIEEMAREFRAPVGLLTLGSALSWSLRTGNPALPWPSPQEASAIAETLRTGEERAGLWKPAVEADHQWLVLAWPEADPSIAPRAPFQTVWIGFGIPEVPSLHAHSWWGPPCPAAALTAWGRDMIRRLQPGPPAAQGPEALEADHQRKRLRLPDRLTQELRVSDPPERFQRLSAEAVRAVLGAEAVAWVPNNPREPVVQAGNVEGLDSHTWRKLAASASGSVEFRNFTDTDTASSDSPRLAEGVQHMLCVSADPDQSSGWLAAVNPIDGRPFEPEAADLIRPVASLIAAQRTNARHYAELKDLLFGVIRSLTSAIDAKDPYTRGHSERVGRIAVQLGEELGLSSNERGDLYLGGLLHDVGKIGVDDAVLKKPGRLTTDEFRQIQQHVRIGVEILSGLKKLAHLLPVVAHHHENYDGTGYPDGLAGDDIPLPARIMAVADAYDAMSSNRPYRRRLSPEQVEQNFQDGAGTQWDPKIVEALFARREQVHRIRQKGLGESVRRVIDDTVGRRGSSVRGFPSRAGSMVEASNACP